MARELNDKKEKYYLQKFVLNKDKNQNEKDGITLEINNEEKCPSRDFFDYTQVCWYCVKNVYDTETL